MQRMAILQPYKAANSDFSFLPVLYKSRIFIGSRVSHKQLTVIKDTHLKDDNKKSFYFCFFISRGVRILTALIIY